MTDEKIISRGRTRRGKEYLIRKYRPEDRDRVRWICSETGFLGKPQEAVFEGRDPFADLWSRYWTDYEPQSALVAEVEGRVEGYLLGCLDTARQERVWQKVILPEVARQMAGPKWWRHQKNRKFIRAFAWSHLRGEFKVPMRKIKSGHPAHLHTNIADPSLRGQGIGKGLMLAYFDYLKAHGVPGVHLGTTSHNREAVPFYLRLGFEIMIKKRLTCYDHAIIDPPLYLLYMIRGI